MAEYKQCQTCDGKGSFYGETCETCDGVGRVVAPQALDMGNSPLTSAVFEKVAARWDGCEGEGCDDIGAALRDDFACFAAQTIGMGDKPTQSIDSDEFRDLVRAHRDAFNAHASLSGSPEVREAWTKLISYIDAWAARRAVPDESRDAAQWRELLAAVMAEMSSRFTRGDGNAPGHGHDKPGIWDGDNGPLAGKECAWCKVWNAARAAIAAASVIGGQCAPALADAPQAASGCAKCGSTGIHACPGAPIPPWTPEKIAEFNRILDEYEPEATAQPVEQTTKGEE